MDTFISRYVKVRAANETGATFPSRVATITEPSGTGVIVAPQRGEYTRGTCKIVPYGAGADNATTNMRVLGWRPSGALWIPTILAEVSCTLSTAVGVTGQDILDTERIADTISGVIGTAGSDYQLFSPANNTPAYVLVDTKGCPDIEVLFSVGTATGANALIAFV